MVEKWKMADIIQSSKPIIEKEILPRDIFFLAWLKRASISQAELAFFLSIEVRYFIGSKVREYRYKNTLTLIFIFAA